MHIDELIQPSVGADLARTPPIYRPGERIDGPSADKSAVRQYIVRLRDITDVACSTSFFATRSCLVAFLQPIRNSLAICNTDLASGGDTGLVNYPGTRKGWLSGVCIW